MCGCLISLVQIKTVGLSLPIYKATPESPGVENTGIDVETMATKKKTTKTEYLVGDKWMPEGAEFNLNSVGAMRSISFMTAKEFKRWKKKFGKFYRRGI